MKLKKLAKIRAFTLVEMMIAIAIAFTILGVTLTSSIALEKSFNSVDNYFATHMQQIRIVDYLARDVRRGFSVTSSLDKQTVTVKIPRYIIQAADSDATPSTIGTPRSPKLAISSGDYNINYGTTATNQISTIVYQISGSSILRTEDGVVTTIASSTDNLIPETVDVELANTEYTTTAITFKPISVADRNGTVVYSTAYLRNRRRSL
ncbi:MAG: hypothetical protein DME40_18665 [Verrucomicrobia bacterium]|nr:MAG: hypothetical protein DME40_18665 [Verrucomicrobiota bacterium]